MANLPVCPLLSIRGPINELCLGEDCALFIAGPQKCSLMFVGYHALMQMQQLQKPAAPPRPAP